MNNFNKILNLLTFDNKDLYYHIDIIQRKKDNPHFTAKDDCYRIKTFFITSEAYFRLRFEEIEILCESFNARAYINLNRRSFERTSIRLLQRMSERFLGGMERLIKDDFVSLSTDKKGKCERKYYLVDVDTKDDNILTNIIEIIKTSRSGFNYNEIICETIETKNGYHLIVKPFDGRKLKIEYPTNLVEIKENDPTLLYCKD